MLQQQQAITPSKHQTPHQSVSLPHTARQHALVSHKTHPTTQHFSVRPSSVAVCFPDQLRITWVVCIRFCAKVIQDLQNKTKDRWILSYDFDWSDKCVFILEQKQSLEIRNIISHVESLSLESFVDECECLHVIDLDVLSWRENTLTHPCTEQKSTYWM